MRKKNIREEKRYKFSDVIFGKSLIYSVFILASLFFIFSPPAFASDQAPVSILIQKPNVQELRATDTRISVPPGIKRRSPLSGYIIWNSWWRTWIVDEHFGFGITPLSLKDDPFAIPVKFRDPWEPIEKSELKARKMKWIVKAKENTEEKLDESHASFLNYGIRFSWSSYLYFKDWNREFKEKHHLHPNLKLPLSWKTFTGQSSLDRVDAELKYKRSFDSFSELMYTFAGTKDLKRIDYWLLWKRFNDVGAVKHTIWRPFRSIPILKQIDQWTPIERLDDLFTKSIEDQNEEFIIPDYN